MVELFVHCPKAAFDISKAITVRQLGKGHAQVLVVAFKRTNPVVALIPVNAPPELVHW
jgi:hypothetical protein